MDNIIVRLKDLPCGINGVTILDEDGNYNIYINARLSYYGQHEAYQHELKHIQRDDFYNNLPIQEVEQI